MPRARGAESRALTIYILRGGCRAQGSGYCLYMFKGVFRVQGAGCICPERVVGVQYIGYRMLAVYVQVECQGAGHGVLDIFDL